MKKLVFINDVPKFNIKAGTIVNCADYDVTTDEYIVRPSEFDNYISPNYRFKKGANVEELKTREESLVLLERLKNPYPRCEAIYEDAIIGRIGVGGLFSLRYHHLIETCGSIEGRKIYAL